MLKRRGFLKGFAAVLAAAAVGPVLPAATRRLPRFRPAWSKELLEIAERMRAVQRLLRGATVPAPEAIVPLPDSSSRMPVTLGPECDKTFRSCARHGNETRFGGQQVPGGVTRCPFTFGSRECAGWPELEATVLDKGGDPTWP